MTETHDRLLEQAQAVETQFQRHSERVTRLGHSNPFESRPLPAPPGVLEAVDDEWERILRRTRPGVSWEVRP